MRRDAGSGADIGEGALAVVAIEHARQALVVQRVAIHPDAALRIAAEPIVGPGRVEVVGDEEIQVAVAIGVQERAAGAPAWQPDAGGARDVGEDAVAGVPVERVGAVVGDVQVHATVVVHVACARTLAVLGGPDRRRRGDIGELSRPGVAEQPVTGARRHGGIGERAAIHHEHVHPPVGVVVEEHRARSHRLDEKLVRAGAVDVLNREAGSLGDVLERERRRSGRGARTLGARHRHAGHADQRDADHQARRAWEPGAGAWSFRFHFRSASSIALRVVLEPAALGLHRFALQPLEHRQFPACLLFASEPQQRPAGGIARVEQCRVERDRPLQHRQRSLIVAIVGVHLADGGKRARALRVDQRGNQELGQRVVEPVLRAIDAAEIEAGVARERCQGDAALVGAGRGRQVQRVVLQAADRPVDQRRAGKRRQARRGLVGPERTSLVVAILAEPAEPPLGLARGGKCGDGLQQHVARRAGIPRRDQHVAQGDSCAFVAGVQADGGPEAIGAARVILERPIGDAQQPLDLRRGLLSWNRQQRLHGTPGVLVPERGRGGPAPRPWREPRRSPAGRHSPPPAGWPAPRRASTRGAAPLRGHRHSAGKTAPRPTRRPADRAAAATAPVGRRRRRRYATPRRAAPPSPARVSSTARPPGRHR